ncbi:uncharacterized protein LOC122254253 [Penaeus japonicus]|uniref:uncharacterized protein LOC122254253 n=1 Tax=Penaeus japonicus TaxID=27405 RepID=UPI001C713BB2|nr:uncharacterized protein LOC122254253 [Penaeus japonicus]
MSGRGFRKPYARQRRESDEGEEEGFLYCLMYYFDEARRESEDGGERRARRARRYCEDEEEEQAAKKKEDDDEEEMLNPLVYRESLTGRSMRGGMMRRAYTPDRDALARTSAATSLRSRSHSQPPEINHNNVSRRARKKK